MCRDDSDIPRLQLDDLHLPRRSTGKCQQLFSQTSQAQWIIPRLEGREFLWGRGESKDVDGVQQHDDYSSLGEANPKDRSTELERDGRPLFHIIPDD